MATTKTDDRAAAKIIERRAGVGTFVLGRRAFAKISAVEGIHPSRRLEAELCDLDQAGDDERRSALAARFFFPANVSPK